MRQTEKLGASTLTRQPFCYLT